MKDFLSRTMLVSAGGHVWECLQGGVAEPRIVLLNGAGVSLEGWVRVWPQLTELGSVFAYNRLGVGKSSKPTQAQNAEVVLCDLRDLLGYVGFAPPYVLVGHSLGGLYLNLFARMYPHELSAAMFLEATHPADLELQTKAGWLSIQANKFLEWVAPSSPHNEIKYVQASVDAIATAPTFPDIPICVLSGTKQPLMGKAALDFRLRNQHDLLTLSSKHQHVLATHSGHFPQLSEPAVVVDALRDLIATR